MKKLIFYVIVCSLFCVSCNSLESINLLNYIDYILIQKVKKKMYTYHNGKRIKEYNISIGRGSLENKSQEGDNRTPEGIYRITHKNNKSSYYKSLKISYPSIEDEIKAKNLGLNVGSNIMIHGIKNGLGWIGQYHSLINWTRGCIAISNSEMDEIFNNVDTRTVVEIRR